MKRRGRGTPKVQGGDGRTGTPASGRHSPPTAGGGKDPQFRGGPFSAGIPAFGVIRTREGQTPFAALRVPCLRPVKADGQEPPAALRAAVPAGGRRSKPSPPIAPSAIRALTPIRTVGVPAAAFSQQLAGVPVPARHPGSRRPGRSTFQPARRTRSSDSARPRPCRTCRSIPRVVPGSCSRPTVAMARLRRRPCRTCPQGRRQDKGAPARSVRR